MTDERNNYTASVFNYINREKWAEMCLRKTQNAQHAMHHSVAACAAHRLMQEKKNSAHETLIR